MIMIHFQQLVLFILLLYSRLLLTQRHSVGALDSYARLLQYKLRFGTTGDSQLSNELPIQNPDGEEQSTNSTNSENLQVDPCVFTPCKVDRPTKSELELMATIPRLTTEAQILETHPMISICVKRDTPHSKDSWESLRMAAMVPQRSNVQITQQNCQAQLREEMAHCNLIKLTMCTLIDGGSKECFFNLLNQYPIDETYGDLYDACTLMKNVLAGPVTLPPPTKRLRLSTTTFPLLWEHSTASLRTTTSDKNFYFQSTIAIARLPGQDRTASSSLATPPSRSVTSARTTKPADISKEGLFTPPPLPSSTTTIETSAEIPKFDESALDEALSEESTLTRLTLLL